MGMSFKLSLVSSLMLINVLISTTSSIVAKTGEVHETNQTRSIGRASNSSREQLDTSPSITSVHHQVWTSSSSGSLDELSPEIIGKLRQDVPFLAAYALRPRLVGGLVQQVAPTVSPLAPQTVGSEMGARQPASVFLESAASSPKVARQSTPIASSQRQSTPNGLGDFSEFKVETSSTSRSEHHHKRKTSLKREQAKKERSAPTSNLRRRPSSGLGSLASKKQAAGKRRLQPVSGRKKARRGSKRRRQLRTKSSSRLREAKKRTRRIGRIVDQEAKGKEAAEGKRIEEGDTKGGSSKTNKKQPFYAGAQPKESSTTKPVEGQAKPALDAGTEVDANEKGLAENGVDNEASGGPNESSNENEDNELDEADGPELMDEVRGEPRRVGDDDVEEDGDTVLVEPKSDGVDDDPELPSEKEEGADREEPTEATASSGRTTPNQVDKTEGPEEARGKRVNRERPNAMQPDGEDTNDGSGPAGSDNSAAVGGGGIGATLGGGGQDGVAKESPGVEFANENNNDDDDERGLDNGQARSGSDGSGSSQDRGRGLDTVGGESEADGGFGKRREGDAPATVGRDSSGGSADGSSRTTGGGSTNEDDNDEDLDYRDEMAERGLRPVDRKSVGNPTMPSKSAPPSVGDDGKDACDNGAGRAHDDGSYKAHDEKYHDDHHQTIDWLRGSIPGEPDDDYPILDRVINGTNFRCSDQKHPGYYADVEARCQIFHICQADGRQDSFLCPNGTIFSQKSLVCVWWNGFHCEDAPKLYHLNELLYKSTSGRDSPQAAALPSLADHSLTSGGGDALRPLGGDARAPSMRAGPIKPRAMRVDVDESESSDEDDADSSIESLLRAMRRRNSMGGQMSSLDSAGHKRAKGGSMMAASNDDEDEASMQRKSSTLDLDGADPIEASSPLRSKDNNLIPRRKRRASARQAPPKLKSRRVSRNSRRRKLRHGIKPKRRA